MIFSYVRNFKKLFIQFIKAVWCETGLRNLIKTLSAKLFDFIYIPFAIPHVVFGGDFHFIQW